MRLIISLLVTFAVAPLANAADIEAGKAKAAVVCAACPGATGVSFPENYQATFIKYHTINFPATKQVRYYYANAAAVKAAKAGASLPDGSVLFAEI